MQRITITPTSPTKGTKYSLCYDFTGLPSDVVSVTLKGTHVPAQPDDPVWVTINRTGGEQPICTQVEAPSAADGVLWVDVTNGSPSAGATFS